MRRGLWAIVVGSFSCASGILPAAAQSGPEWVQLRLRGAIRPDITWEGVRTGMMASFRASNPGERGITQEGLDALRRINLAQRRAQILQQIQASDLDGDGRVTRAELLVVLGQRARQPISANGVQLDPTPEQIRLQLERLVADGLAPDLDHDGVVAAGEMLQYAQAKAEEQLKGWNNAQFVPLTLDANADGAVSEGEFTAAVRSEFEAIDADHDGRVSAEEARLFGERLRQVQQASVQREMDRTRRANIVEAAKACNAVRPPASAKLVAVGAYQGRALSNVSIGGDDRETSVANLDIAAGTEPLFIVVASYDAMVWRVSGATERVAGLFATSVAADPTTQRPRVGVVGLPRDKVQFATSARCLPYFTDRDLGTAAEPLEVLFGRKPDAISGIYGAQSVRVPSLQHIDATPSWATNINLPTTGPGAPMWQELQRFHPAGLASIDPAAVVSPLPVKRYEVLAQQAGLAQLLDEGTLVATGSSHGFNIDGGKMTPFTMPSRFLIVRKTRFPAGLNGAHSVTFVLARGVPMPEGSAGHSCVLSEETGKPITPSPICR